MNDKQKNFSIFFSSSLFGDSYLNSTNVGFNDISTVRKVDLEWRLTDSREYEKNKVTKR